MIARLKESLGDKEFASRLVEGAGVIDLGAELSPYGLHVERVGARTRVSVASQPSGSQRDLLRQIGYNSQR
ncbi:MAG: hypothetical protein LC746_18355 [Acidobacteria bacterium]|nr:hypothetical protein [Acidobacteriota bacterium]